MKGIIFSLVLASSIVVIVQSESHFRITLLRPRGFRLELKDAGQCWTVMVTGRILSRTSQELGSFDGNLLRLTSSRWMYQNLTAVVNRGDSIILQVNCVPEGEYDNNRGVIAGVMYTVPDNAIRVAV